MHFGPDSAQLPKLNKDITCGLYAPHTHGGISGSTAVVLVRAAINGSLVTAGSVEADPTADRAGVAA